MGAARRGRRTVVCLAALLWMAGAAQAEVLRLKNGNAVEGTITSRTDDEVVMEIPGAGAMTFRTDEIKLIESPTIPVGRYAHRVLLTNGNLITGRVVRQDDRQVEISVPGTGTVTFPMADVAAVEDLPDNDIARLEASFEQQETARKHDGWASHTGSSPRSAGPREPKADGAPAASDAPPVSRPSGAFDQDDVARIEQEVAEQKARAMAGVRQAMDLVKRTGLSAASARIAAPQADPQTTLVLRVLDKLKGAFGIWLAAFIVGLMIYYAVCLQVLAERTGTPDEWLAWFPILNIYLACQVGRRPGWWLLLYAVPVIGMLIDVAVWMGISEVRGKPPWLGLLMLLPVCNWVVVGYLAFGKDPVEQKNRPMRIPASASS